MHVTIEKHERSRGFRLGMSVKAGLPSFKTVNVIGMSSENKIIFFGKIDDHLGFCVVYGPSDTCFPDGPNDNLELFNTKVAIGQVKKEMSVHEVKCGHKYYQGGGWVETNDDLKISFSTNKPCLFCGKVFSEVYRVR